jgi:hypothetical protein
VGQGLHHIHSPFSFLCRQPDNHLFLEFQVGLAHEIIVPDYESRDRDVVLVMLTTYFWETPGCREFGMGRDWGGFEEGEVSSRATWGQGGRDRTTQKEGFQVSKRGLKGESKGNQQGE